MEVRGIGEGVGHGAKVGHGGNVVVSKEKQEKKKENLLCIPWA
jgi:hypothetical protein